eukprot:1967961-Pyramimonas_sp.AAC.3
MQELPYLYMLAGTLGFFVNITTWAVIKRTSALTLKVRHLFPYHSRGWFSGRAYSLVTRTIGSQDGHIPLSLARLVLRTGISETPPTGTCNITNK